MMFATCVTDGEYNSEKRSAIASWTLSCRTQDGLDKARQEAREKTKLLTEVLLQSTPKLMPAMTMP